MKISGGYFLRVTLRELAIHFCHVLGANKQKALKFHGILANLFSMALLTKQPPAKAGGFELRT